MFAIDKYILLCYNNNGKGDMSMENNKKNLPNWAKLKKTILLSLVASTALAAFSGIFIACDENENNENNQNNQNQEELTDEERLAQLEQEIAERINEYRELEDMAVLCMNNGDIENYIKYSEEAKDYYDNYVYPLQREYNELYYKLEAEQQENEEETNSQYQLEVDESELG